MKAVYINDGSIPRRENHGHSPIPIMFGKVGEITEIDEAEGTFEFIPDVPIGLKDLSYDGKERIRCYAEELRFVNPPPLVHQLVKE